MPEMQNELVLNYFILLVVQLIVQKPTKIVANQVILMKP
jgi:hypothetical protein